MKRASARLNTSSASASSARLPHLLLFHLSATAAAYPLGAGANSLPVDGPGKAPAATPGAAAEGPAAAGPWRPLDAAAAPAAAATDAPVVPVACCGTRQRCQQSIWETELQTGTQVCMQL